MAYLIKTLQPIFFVQKLILINQMNIDKVSDEKGASTYKITPLTRLQKLVNLINLLINVLAYIVTMTSGFVSEHGSSLSFFMVFASFTVRLTYVASVNLFTWSKRRKMELILLKLYNGDSSRIVPIESNDNWSNQKPSKLVGNSNILFVQSDKFKRVCSRDEYVEKLKNSKKVSNETLNEGYVIVPELGARNTWKLWGEIFVGVFAGVAFYCLNAKVYLYDPLARGLDIIPHVIYYLPFFYAFLATFLYLFVYLNIVAAIWAKFQTIESRLKMIVIELQTQSIRSDWKKTNSRLYLEEAEHLCRQYDNISDCVDLLNTQYGPFVFLVFAQAVIACLDQVDEYVNSRDVLTIAEILADGMGAVYVVIVTCYLTVLCSNTVNTTKRIATYVNRAIINALDVDDNLKNFYQMFAEVVQQRDVYFSANGFFSVQLDVLLSMLSVMMTYAVVLYQSSPHVTKTGKKSN